MPVLLTAQQILDARDGRTMEVEVPEWGGSVLVGSMGALDHARLADWMLELGRPKEDEDDGPLTCDSPPPDESPPPRQYTAAENAELMVRYCAACIMDPQSRRRAFDESQVEALGRKSATALRRVYDAALAINLDTKEARDDAEKN